MSDFAKAVSSILRQCTVNWKSVRAILVPFVAVSVPLGILLVLEFRSLSRFEMASAQILRRSAVHASEELARRIVDASRTLQELQDVAGRESSPDGIGSRRRREGSISLLPASPAGSWSEFQSRGGPGAAPIADAYEGTDWSRTLGSEALTREREVRAGEWRPSAGSLDVVGIGEPPVYYGVVPEADPTRSAEPVDGDGTTVTNGVYPVARELIVDSYLPRLLADMRDRRHSLDGAPSLELAVMDDRGVDIYRTGPSLANSWVHEVRFPFLVSDPDAVDDLIRVTAESPLWRVRAGYPGTTVEDLARSETNQQRQLLFWVAVVAGIGIALSVRATAREVKLAEMKSDFISSVSHDLKTPLASIRVFAETLASRRAQNEDKVRQYGEMVGLEVRRLDQMINDILDFNKIEDGDRKYRIEEVDLREIVDEILAYFRPRLREANFEFELDLPPTEVRFLGNREGLLQALGNLVSNAIKFRNEGPGSTGNHLKISLAVIDDNAVIEVADRGIGIPPGDRAQVFEKFYRVVRKRDTDVGGTGLGLAIVAHVVEAHGGRVTLEGNRHGGSTFKIELPLCFS